MPNGSDAFDFETDEVNSTSAEANLRDWAMKMGLEWEECPAAA
jgi:hypothetical protein